MTRKGPLKINYVYYYFDIYILPFTLTNARDRSFL